MVFLKKCNEIFHIVFVVVLQRLCLTFTVHFNTDQPVKVLDSELWPAVMTCTVSALQLVSLAESDIICKTPNTKRLLSPFLAWPSHLHRFQSWGRQCLIVCCKEKEGPPLKNPKEMNSPYKLPKPRA